MATYTRYNFQMPTGTYKDYMPEYTTYSAKKPNETYRDTSGAYSGEISKAQNSLNQVLNNKPGAYQSQYSQRIDDLVKQMSGRKFSYDSGTDPLVKYYNEQYMNQGKQAMADATAQAAALTGGYGNSYGATVGNQAYQSYLGQINDKIPELYQLALERYNSEGNELQNMYSIYANQEANDCGKYRDRVSDFQSDRNYYDAALNNLRSMNQSLYAQDWNNYWTASQMNDSNRQNAINTALTLLGQDWDNYKWGESQTAANYAQAVAEDQYNANLALQYAQLEENQRQFDARNSDSGTSTTANGAYQSSFYNTTGKNRYDNPGMRFTAQQYTGWQNQVGMNRTIEGRCAAIEDAYNEGKITSAQANATLAKFGIDQATFARIRGVTSNK